MLVSGGTRMFRFALAALLITLTATPALAGPDDDGDPDVITEDPGPRVVYKKRTELEIGELRVDGAIKKPLGAGVAGRRAQMFNPLITLKGDFALEMIESVNQIR